MDSRGRGAALTRRAALLLGLSGVTGCGLTGCGDGEQSLETTSGKAIDEAIGALWEAGGERALADIVDIDFDEVMVLPEGTPAEHVNDAAGTTLLNGKYCLSSTQLFLFRAEGIAVLAALVASDVFEHEVQNATFGPDVRMVAPGDQQLITLEG